MEHYAFDGGLTAEFERVSKVGEALYENLEKARVTMDSSDGLVTATVGGRGEVIDLELDPRIYQSPNAEALAKTIVDTIRAGYEAATEESWHALEKLKDDSGGMRNLIENLQDTWDSDKQSRR